MRVACLTLPCRTRLSGCLSWSSLPNTWQHGTSCVCDKPEPVGYLPHSEGDTWFTRELSRRGSDPIAMERVHPLTKHLPRTSPRACVVQKFTKQGSACACVCVFVACHQVDRVICLPERAVPPRSVPRRSSSKRDRYTPRGVQSYNTSLTSIYMRAHTNPT